MFETNPRDLRDLLREAHEGRLQLPDFQRSYVWAEEDVVALIASVARGFPVGALLTLASGGTVNFKPRLLEGVPPIAVEHDHLLLDGQQRITSLYGALWSKEPMRTRLPHNPKKAVERFFYIDIQKALSAGEDITDAILAVRADRKIWNDFDVVRDLSCTELEHAEDCFPLNLCFDSSAERNWFWEWQQYWRERRRDVSQLQRDFFKSVLEPIQNYKMPVIRLSKDSSREAICLIFEKVNVGGKKLDAFELVTAIFAGQPEPLDLRRDWDAERRHKGRFERIVKGKNATGHENRALAEVRGIDFLQAVSLVHSLARREAARAANALPLPQVSCKRDAILGLPLAEYRKHSEAIEDGFRKAGRFLNDCKILWERDVPYPAQIVALATVYASLGPAADTQAARERLTLWFWRTALAEDYGTSTETKLARDAEELPRWIAGGEPPERLSLLTFNRFRLDTLRNRIAAAYKALSALLLGRGCRDFVTGAPADLYTFAADPMDIHHIFPRAWCERNGISRERYDSIINKTPLTAASNRMIGGSPPCDYLRKIEEKIGIPRASLDAILESHLIDPDLVRTRDPTVADFDRFFEVRRNALASLALAAMGQTDVARPSTVDEPTRDLDMDDEAA